MTVPPPADLAAETPQESAAFDLERTPDSWRSDDARFAILSHSARVVYASPAALALFEAQDLARLEASLLGGEGPTARRLRRLMETLPIGEAPRLERMRVFVDRRPMSVNLSCARVAAPNGEAALLISAPALGASAEPVAAHPKGAAPPALAEDAAPPAPPPARSGPAPRARFLWTLDHEGRFGPAHPVLAAAVGANAPSPGETLDEFICRAAIEGGDEFARRVGGRETFAGVLVGWPLANSTRRRRVLLSAAPVFGRGREFIGYRGFGLLDEEVDAPRVEPIIEQETPLEELAPIVAEVVTGEPPQAEPSSVMAEAPLEQGAPPIADEAPIEDSASAPADAGAFAAPLGEADGSETPLALPEAGDADVPSCVALSADAPDAAAESVAPPPEQPGESAEPSLPEASAEIYVLRRATQAAGNVVPIRPGAVEALSPTDHAPSPSTGSVELSSSERDAFREIARALVGRTPPSRHDRKSEAGDEPADAEARDEPASAAPLLEPGSASGADDEAVGRNAAAVLNRLPVGVLVVRDAQVLYVNQTLLDLLGYRDFVEFQAADGVSAMFPGRDPHALAGDGGAVAIVRADGEVLSVDGRAQAVAWDGAPATLIAFRRSFEAERRAVFGEPNPETAPRSGSTRDLQAMLDRATDGAVTLDSAGRILTLNAPAERLFGYAEKDIAGESVLMLLAPQSHPKTTTRLDNLSRADEADPPARPLAVVGRDRSGSALALMMTLARIGPADTPHFCALFRDVSREREAERRLTNARDAALAASAAKTEFLAQVSHEIRTPLHAILGFAEVMLEERFGPIGNERYQDYLKDIHTSGSHVMSLADDLLDLSKIEAGKLELEFAPVDANSLIRECVSLMQPQAARERVIMRTSLNDRLPRVMVDQRSLKQIMLNLISNAVKFNEPGGQVIVSTALDPAGQAVIRVRDTGVGMNENEVGLALAPFSQVGKANGKGGAGLGLPLTKALVEANNAEFSIKSRREQGTLIEIAFPNIQAAQ